MKKSSILIIGCASLLSCWYSPGEASSRSQREQVAASQDIAKSAREIALKITEPRKSDPLTEPCGEGDYNRRSSDLCAQWKAADAARSAANAAWWSVWFSLLATVGLGVTIFFTVQATKAATASAKAASDTLHSGRAWIALAGWEVGPASGMLDGTPLREGHAFIPHFQNYGNSPALKTEVYRHFQIVDYSLDISNFVAPANDESSVSTVVTPGQKISADTIFLDDAQAADFRARKTKVLCAVEIKYRDIYTHIANPPVIRVTRQSFEIVHLGGTFAKNGSTRQNIEIRPIGHDSLAT